MANHYHVMQRSRGSRSPAAQIGHAVASRVVAQRAVADYRADRGHYYSIVMNPCSMRGSYNNPACYVAEQV